MIAAVELRGPARRREHRVTTPTAPLPRISLGLRALMLGALLPLVVPALPAWAASPSSRTVERRPPTRTAKKATTRAPSKTTTKATTSAPVTAPVKLAVVPEIDLNRQVLMTRADRALQARSYSEAAELYRRAAGLDARAGDAPLMAAVAAFQLDDYRQARRDLRRAFRRQLSPEDRDLGQMYLELIQEESGAAQDAELEPFTPTLATRLGGGFDSNPHHAGTSELQSDAWTGLYQGAVFGSAALEMAFEGTPSPGLDLELGYTLEQTAYQDRQLRDLDYQDHLLELALTKEVAEGATLAATLGGELSFTGLGNRLQSFSRAVRADVDVTLGAGSLKLRLGASYQATEVADEDLSFLSGQRVELRAAPQMELRGWRGTLSARLRLDALGSARSAPSWDEQQPLCDDCTTSTVVPYSNRSAALSARVTAPLRWRLRPGLSARLDRRLYHQQAELVQSDTLTGSTTSTSLGDRLSGTAAFGANLRLRLTSSASLTARWDYTRFAGIFRPASGDVCTGHSTCGQGSLANRGFSNQTLSLELSMQWL